MRISLRRAGKIMNHIEIMPTSPKKIEALHKINNNGEKFLMHVHNNYEIYLSMSDDNNFFVGHKVYDVNKFDVFLFSNTDVHKISTSNPNNYERYVVMFSPQLFSKTDPEVYGLLDCFDPNVPNRNHKLSIPKDKRKEFLFLLEKMIECEEREDYHRLLRLRLYLIQLLLLIADIRSENLAPMSLYSTDDDPRINEIMEFIRTHCNEPLSLDMIGKKFYLNKYYLCRLFKAKVGFGISDYIESCRLVNAIHLLREGMSVSTVALRTGFGSDTYFISTFKKNLSLIGSARSNC